MRQRASRDRVRWLLAVLLASRLPACATGAVEAADRHARARQVPVRARHRAARTRASGSPPASTSASSSTAIRRARIRADAKLGVGDTYLGEGTHRSVRARDQRVPGVPVVLSDAPARRLRAVQARRWRTSTRCAAPERDQTETREAIKELDVFLERYAEQRARCRKRRTSCARRGSAERVRVSRRLLLLPVASGIRAPIDRFKAVLERGPGVHRAATRVYFYLAESLIKVEQTGRGAPLLRAAGRRVRAERVSAEAQKRVRSSRRTCKQDRERDA